MPELERWMLHRLWEMDVLMRELCESFHFHALFTELHNFCSGDLSAFYFDIRKDSLYCDHANSTSSRSTRTLLDEIFNCLTAWLAPFICFTAEEAWLIRNKGDEESVHLRVFPEIPEDWRDDDLSKKWFKIRQLRRVVTGALEIERMEKRIGSSLQSAPIIFTNADYKDSLKSLNTNELADLFITSGISFSSAESPADAFKLDDVPGVSVTPELALGKKCERCWKVLESVGSNKKHPDACPRCADAADNHAGSI